MPLACVYRVSATCSTNSGQELREYWGVFKVLANQTRESAWAARLRDHKTRPVVWLGAADVDSIKLTAIGHVMTVENALAEEAIQAAQALGDHRVPSRGGPWSHPKLGQKGFAESAAVRRLANRAPTPAAAREAVLEYARTLDADSYLYRHCLDLSFNRDSAEANMAPPRVLKRKVSGASQSGNRKRIRWGFVSGTDSYNQHKWGADAKDNRKKNNAKRYV